MHVMSGMTPLRSGMPKHPVDHVYYTVHGDGCPTATVSMPDDRGTTSVCV